MIRRDEIHVVTHNPVPASFKDVSCFMNEVFQGFGHEAAGDV
jgi:hypothetical protein